MKTHVVKGGDIDRKWLLVDASGQTLGRLASRVASILRGKDKPAFTPWLDLGDHVIIVNARKVHISGKKREFATFDRYSGYRGGRKLTKLGDLMKSNPASVVHRAVWGMLPHNSLGRRMIKKLRVYAEGDHPHQAQMPETLEIKTRI